VQNPDQNPHEAGAFLSASRLVGGNDSAVVPVVAGPLPSGVAIVYRWGLPEQDGVVIEQDHVLHLLGHGNLK
jgi:hypothetical protein